MPQHCFSMKDPVHNDAYLGASRFRGFVLGVHASAQEK